MQEGPIEAAQPEQTGALIGGHYLVEASLGQGGMGTVYLVRDQRDGRKVALKQLRADRAHRGIVYSQFEREYHTLSQLAHPRIIEVYDYGVEAGFAYYTMELLDGQDLRERGKQPWREVCAVLCDVASSLAILHSRRLLHRDISARNVRCTRDGRAKLIDFGAMAPMGVTKYLVGTPPFVPPEALQLQALDGRADLYALGALAYWMLTGRYAYPARSFDQLRDTWRSTPSSPRQYEPSVPEALDRLVMELIQLDRTGRPGSAAAVMERLSGIAGLTLAERPEVGRAYLSTPTLVGRDAQLQDVRRALVQSMQGKGATILIEADEGAGRSRFLDAAVLEAKLLGTLVLRGDAGDAGADYGVARALGRQLLRESSRLAIRTARPWRSLLSHVLPELDRGSQPPQIKPERRHLQSALRNWFLLAARKKHLVIAVDDVHAIDEPSAALLGALGHGSARHRLSLLLTARSGSQPSAALVLLREIARAVPLIALTNAQTLTLVRSVFGEVDHLNALAEHVFRLAQGHPRWTMALCERLVEQGTARYEAGSWSLPRELSAEDLPPSLTALLSSRVASLSADARELAQALALTDASAIDPRDYATLTAHRDSGRTHRAVDDLVASSVLEPDGNRYRLRQQELASVLTKELAPAALQLLHARIAAAVVECDNPVLLPQHLLLGGREREGIDYLLSLRDHPRLAYSTAVLTLLESAAEHARALAVPMHQQIDLLVWLVAQTALLGDYDRFQRYAWPLLDRLLRDSGLADYFELEAAGMPSGACLQEAIARVEQRHHDAPLALKGHEPALARERLGRLCGIIVSMASVSMELALIERLPSLLPLAPVFPSAELVQLHVETLRAMVSSRYEIASRNIATLNKRLEVPDPALNPIYVKQLRLACRYMSGLLAAGIAHPSTRARLKDLEHEPGHRVLAWRVHTIYELSLGNLEGAADCQRRAELLNLQDGGQLIFPGTTVATELLVYSYADDVIGVKRVMERIAELAATFPGWRPFLDVARAQYYHLQGDSAGALAAIEAALAAAVPGRTQAWVLAVPCHVTLLLATRPVAEALEWAERYFAIVARDDITAVQMALERVMVDVLLKAGRVEDAARLADGLIQRNVERGTKGVRLGLAYEARARVAIAMQDEAELRRNAELCAMEYKGGRNLTLSAKYQTLMRQAEQSGITLTSGLQHAADLDSHGATQTFSGRTASSRLLACVGTDERAQEGLRLLLELTGATFGYLFAVRNGRIEAAPHLEVTAAPARLRELLNAYLRKTLDTHEDITGEDEGAAAPTELAAWADELGRRFEPLLLHGTRNGERTVTAIAALHYENAERQQLRQDVLDMLADVLADEERSGEFDRSALDSLTVE